MKPCWCLYPSMEPMPYGGTEEQLQLELKESTGIVHQQSAPAEGVFEEKTSDQLGTRSRAGIQRPRMPEALYYPSEHTFLKDRNCFTLRLEDTENWLYEDGEDQPKQVYIDKLTELKNLGQPIKTRFLEFEERPKAFDELGKHIQQYMKVVLSFKNGDEQYNHLDAADITKVEKCANEAMEWMNNKMNLQAKQLITVDPVVTAKEIRAKTQELACACNPIVTKAKPKVEPPKEEQAAEQNGPIDGEGDVVKQGSQSTEQNSCPTPQAATETEKKLPDMDID